MTREEESKFARDIMVALAGNPKVIKDIIIDWEPDSLKYFEQHMAIELLRLTEAIVFKTRDSGVFGA